MNPMVEGTRGLDARVLVLNAHYAALRIVGARRAFGLLCKRDKHDRPLAEVISAEGGSYISYDFDGWRELSSLRREFEPEEHDWVRTVRFDIVVPRIVRVLTYNRLPKQQVKLNRRNIYARDDNTCQYCGKKFSTSELSIDHIVPRSQDGGNSWQNVVCCCVKCNVKKGGRTPAQARMRLVRPPVKPRRSPVINVSLSKTKYASWQQFLDHAYWNVELK